MPEVALNQRRLLKTEYPNLAKRSERGITIADIFLQMSLEEAIGYVAFDELIEVCPVFILCPYGVQRKGANWLLRNLIFSSSPARLPYTRCNLLSESCTEFAGYTKCYSFKKEIPGS